MGLGMRLDNARKYGAAEHNRYPHVLWSWSAWRNPGSAIICVAFGKLLNLFVPQYLHL